MKKTTLIYSLLLITYSSTCFAVSDQLAAANAYLNQLNTKNLSGSPSTKAPTTDLRIGSRFGPIKDIQSYIGVSPTGVLDSDTSEQIKSYQEAAKLNETGTLDLNTWYALYPHSYVWQKYVIEQAYKNWSQVISKQASVSSRKFLVVNIPSMTVTGYSWNNETKQAKKEIESDVIIGKPTTKTPLKDFNITSIKYHPTWTPTPAMLKRSVYKNGGVNYKWLSSHRLTAYDKHGHKVPISQAGYDRNITFRQAAGASNALGLLKFETDSPDNIYLHDTNERRLFSKNVRAYSSGCVRVKDFVELADWLRNKEDTEEVLTNSSHTFYEKINKTPVYLTYTRVRFIDDVPVFTSDIYNLYSDYK